MEVHMPCGPTNYDFLIPDFHFSEVCRLHDKDYDKIIDLGKSLIASRTSKEYGSSVNGFIISNICTKLEYHREIADNIFLVRMKMKNRTLTCSVKRKLADFVAYVYYHSVRRFGSNIIQGAL
jgi:hypothetical protein